MTLLDAPAAPEVVLLEDATTEQWSAILRHTVTRAVPAGQLVLGPEDPPRTLCLLVEGEVSACVPETGAVVRTMPAPAVMGEISFLDGRERSLALRADAEATALLLTWDRYEVLRQEDPELAHRLLVDLGRIVAGRLRDMTTAVIATLED